MISQVGVTENLSAPVRSHADIQAYYDSEYYAHTKVHSAILPWHLRTSARRLGELRGKAVLDVACGTGAWLKELANRGARMAGTDISIRAMEISRTLVPDADLREGVAEALPFEDERFDIVTCLGSLEHFVDQRLALAEMQRVARKEAKFLFLVPNAHFLTRRLGLYSGTEQSAILEDVKSLAEWEALFSDVGLQVSQRWRDLRMLSWGWILRGPWLMRGPRLVQALVLPTWPVAWQYQVYFVCQRAP